jgi:hypothetical protein
LDNWFSYDLFVIDFWRAAIGQQFHAAIDMLANAIEACPDSVWIGQRPGAFWYLAFHTLFFVDLYLSPVDEDQFRPPLPFGLTELQDEGSACRNPRMEKRNCSVTWSIAGKSWMACWRG